MSRRWLERPAWAAAGLLALLLVAPACAKKKRSDVVTFGSTEQAYRQGVELLAKGDLRRAKSTLEQVRFVEQEDRERYEPLVRLAIADATFYQGNDLALIDSRSLYLDFVTLFTDHPKAAYAQFQAAICSLDQAAHPAKDQTQTLQAIADFNEVERRFSRSAFAPAARLMARRAELRLAEHEFLVGRFYLKRKSPLAAIERFRRLLDRFPHYPEKEKIYYYLGESLLRAKNDTEGRIYLDKVLRDYPNGPWHGQARKALDRRGLSPQTALEIGSGP